MKTKYVALLSDFGTADPFVSIMKGIILSRAPKATIIDITHEVPAQNIQMASFYLMSSMSYMPKGTLFVCVVDPTVGTKRNILWARTENYQFVAPDNGLISWVEQKEKIEEVRNVENRSLFLENVSATFHGRDIMAPVGGEIANGISEDLLGPLTTEYKRVPFPQPVSSMNTITGQVIAIDHFGNAITNISNEKYTGTTSFLIAGKMIYGVKPTYASVMPGDVVALTGSFGFLEISIRNGNFAKEYNIKIGTKIETLGTLDD